MTESKPYILDKGEGFVVEPPMSLRYRACYKVWPDKRPMPDFYSQIEILQASSFQIFNKKEEAIEFSNVLGKTPVYWLRHEGEHENSQLVVTRII